MGVESCMSKQHVHHCFSIMSACFSEDVFPSSPSSYHDSLPGTPLSLTFESIPPSPDSVTSVPALLPTPAVLPGLTIEEATEAELLVSDAHFVLVGLANASMSSLEIVDSFNQDLKYYGAVSKVWSLPSGVFGVRMESLEAAWKVIRSPPLFSAAKCVEMLRLRLPPLPDQRTPPNLTLYMLSAPRHILPSTLKRLLEDCKLPAPAQLSRLEDEGMVIWKLTFKSQVELDYVLRRQVTVDRKPTVLLPSPKTQTELIERIAELEVKVTWSIPLRDIELFEALRDRFGTLVELQPFWKQNFAIAVFQYRDSVLKALAKGLIETPSSTLKIEPVESYYRLFGYLILRPGTRPGRAPRKVPRRF